MFNLMIFVSGNFFWLHVWFWISRLYISLQHLSKVVELSVSPETPQQDQNIMVCGLCLIRVDWDLKGVSKTTYEFLVVNHCYVMTLFHIIGIICLDTIQLNKNISILVDVGGNLNFTMWALLWIVWQLLVVPDEKLVPINLDGKLIIIVLDSCRFIMSKWQSCH